MKETYRIPERRTVSGDKVDTIKVGIEGGITGEELAELLKASPGMVVLEHYVTLYKPRLPEAEVDRLKAAVDGLAKLDLSTALKADLIAAVESIVKPVRAVPIEIGPTELLVKELP